MLFEIDFNKPNFYDNDFFENVLGAKLKIFEEWSFYEIEIANFEQLEEILRLVDMKYNVISDAIVSFDPPTIYLDF